MSKSPEQLPYDEKKASGEAFAMKRKVQSGEALDYTKANELIEARKDWIGESRLQAIESLKSQQLLKQINEIANCFDDEYGGEKWQRKQSLFVSPKGEVSLEPEYEAKEGKIIHRDHDKNWYKVAEITENPYRDLKIKAHELIPVENPELIEKLLDSYSSASREYPIVIEGEEYIKDEKDYGVHPKKWLKIGELKNSEKDNFYFYPGQEDEEIPLGFFEDEEKARSVIKAVNVGIYGEDKGNPGNYFRKRIEGSHSYAVRASILFEEGVISVAATRDVFSGDPETVIIPETETKIRLEKEHINIDEISKLVKESIEKAEGILYSGKFKKPRSDNDISNLRY